MRQTRAVEQWEHVQARAAFLLPIIRAVELAIGALTVAAAVFLANAEGGVLLTIARQAWSDDLSPGSLFTPVFTSAALVIGFFAGPYIEAARRMRSDAGAFAVHARIAAAKVHHDPANGFAKIRPDELDALREVIRRSHDYVRRHPDIDDSPASLARHAAGLARYWDKRAGNSRLTPDLLTPGDVQARYRTILKRRARLWTHVALLGCTSLIAWVVVMRYQRDDLTVLATGLLVLLLFGQVKRSLLPFAAL